jgi:hypothetical protein
MAQTSWPYTSQATTDIEYSRLFRELQDDGVVGSFGDTSLKVSADSSGMNVKVAAGSAIIQGYMHRSTAIETIAIAASGAIQRVDRIALRLDITAAPATARIVIVYKQGTPAASNPVPPALTQIDGGVWEIGLGTVAVAASASSIAAGNVTEERPWIGARLGLWTTATRPGSARKRRMGFNETLSIWEVWDGAAWAPLTQTVTWGSLSGVPATFAPIIGTTGTTAAAGDHLHDTRYYQKAETDNLLIAKAALVHTHDDRYFTEAETNSLLAGKAASSHTHTAAQIASGYPASNVGSSGLGFATNVDSAITWLRDNKLDISAYNASSAADSVTSGAYGRGPVSSYYAMYMNGNLQISRNTSSRRYKEDITDPEVNLLDVLKNRPVMYKRIADESGAREVGLIAEEADEVTPWLVMYDVERDEDGIEVEGSEARPEAVAYEDGTFVVALLAVCQEQQRLIEELTARLDKAGI